MDLAMLGAADFFDKAVAQLPKVHIEKDTATVDVCLHSELVEREVESTYSEGQDNESTQLTYWNVCADCGEIVSLVEADGYSDIY